MKFGEYYKDEIKKRKERKTQSAAEVEELKKKVDSFPQLVAEKVEERIREIIPPGLMEGIAAWNAAGRVGPIQVPSMTGSNSAVDVSPDVVTQPAAANTERDYETPAAGTGRVSTLEAAGRVSTLEELNAITKVTS
jgi:hypothetical protein